MRDFVILLRGHRRTLLLDCCVHELSQAVNRTENEGNGLLVESERLLKVRWLDLLELHGLFYVLDLSFDFFHDCLFFYSEFASEFIQLFFDFQVELFQAVAFTGKLDGFLGSETEVIKARLLICLWLILAFIFRGELPILETLRLIHLLVIILFDNHIRTVLLTPISHNHRLLHRFPASHTVVHKSTQIFFLLFRQSLNYGCLIAFVLFLEEGIIRLLWGWGTPERILLSESVDKRVVFYFFDLWPYQITVLLCFKFFAYLLNFMLCRFMERSSAAYVSLHL